MKKFSVIFLFHTFLLTGILAQSIDSIGIYEDVLKKIHENKNIVDSLGRKQGMWTEYKVLWSEKIEGETIPAIKDGEKVLIVYDKEIYNEKSPIITCKGKYLDNLKTGLWKEYYPNDTIKSEIEYKKGIPFGEFRMYWGNGQLKAECIIGNGFKIPVVAYDEIGNIVYKGDAEKNTLIRSIYKD